MEEQISNEKELFTDEEIAKVMEDFDESVAIDGIDCIIYGVTTREGRVRSHVRGMKLNVILCILSIIDENNITLGDLARFKILKSIMGK